MPKPEDTEADEQILTEQWHVSRSAHVITLKDRKKTKDDPYKKEYPTTHGAVCAMGRMRYDHNIIDQIVRNIRVDEIRGEAASSPKKKKKPTLVRSDHLLYLAIHRLDSKGKMSTTFKKLLSDYRRRLKKGEPLKGLNEIRTLINDANKELAKEFGS